MRFLLPLLFICIFSCNDEKTNGTRQVSIPKEPILKAPELDVSPMDMVYYPLDYPKLKMTDSIEGDPVMRIIYSRPHRSNRKIFGGLLPFGQPWRLGANESTEIHFFKPVTIQNKKIVAGRYIIYAILEPDNWTVALNSNVDTWGLQQDSTKDVARFRIPVEYPVNTQEFFTITFEKKPTGADLVMGWDDVIARLPISF